MNALATKSTAASQPARKKQSSADPLRLRPAAFQSKPIYQPTIQLKANCACGGGCPRCNDEDLGIQTKLVVGEAGDTYEQEADQVADLVMRMPDSSAPRTDGASVHDEEAFTVGALPDSSHIQRSAIEGQTSESHSPESALNVSRSFTGNSVSFGAPVSVAASTRISAKVPSPAHSVLQRQSDEQAEEQPELEASPLQMSVAAAGGLVEPPDDEDTKPNRTLSQKSTFTNSRTPVTHSTAQGIEESLQRSRGGGLALPPRTRAFMEERFDMDLSGVRVHTSAESNQLNRRLHAYAFTIGHDIHFAEGMYRPGSPAGDRLLAHELTHVVQQTGGVAFQRAPRRSEMLIQRFGDDETKSYTIPGNVVHKALEKELEEVNTKMMTEVPIPGGFAGDQGLNLRGFADLYESEDGIVTGIRGKYPSSDPKNPLYYENIHNLGRLSPPDRAKQGPRILARDSAKKVTSWDTNPDFPSWFKVADIKPLSLYRIAGGGFQLNNYIIGFQEFVKKVNADSGTTRATTAGAELQIKLPEALDYKKFDTQYDKLEKHAVVLPKILTHPIKLGKHKRYWVYELPKPKGIYVYFPLPHPYLSSTYPKDVEEILKKLDPLLVEIRDKNPKLPAQASPKRKPDVAPTGLAPMQRFMRAGNGRTIQLQHDAEYWRKRSVAWEERRQAWDAGENGAKSFLKNAAKGPLERLEVDAALKLPASGSLLQQNKALKQIELWSGPSGKLLGVLRFRFGALFDKLGSLYERVKKWFDKREQHKGKGLDFGSGPIATAAEVAFGLMKQFLVFTAKRVGDNLVSALQSGATALLTHVFSEAVTERFSENIAALQEKVEEIRSIAEGLHEKFEEKIGGVLSFFEDATKFLNEVRGGLKTVGDILSLVKWGIRLFHCVSPPLVGCLKLLLEKLSEKLIELVIKSCWFQGKAIRPLFNTFKFFKEMPQNISNKILELLREILPLRDPELSILLPLKVDVPETDVKEGDLKCAADKPTPEQKYLVDMFDKHGEKKVEQFLKLLEAKNVDDGAQLNVWDLKRIDKVLSDMSDADLEKAAKDPEAIKGSPAGISLEDLVSKIKLDQLTKSSSEFTSQLMETADMTGKIADKVLEGQISGIYKKFDWQITFNADQIKNNRVSATYYELHKGENTAALVQLEIITLDTQTKWISARVVPSTLLVNAQGQLGDTVERVLIEGTYFGGEIDSDKATKK
jgi:hypothetical protein